MDPCPLKILDAPLDFYTICADKHAVGFPKLEERCSWYDGSSGYPWWTRRLHVLHRNLCWSKSTTQSFMVYFSFLSGSTGVSCLLTAHSMPVILVFLEIQSEFYVVYCSFLTVSFSFLSAIFSIQFFSVSFLLIYMQRFVETYW